MGKRGSSLTHMRYGHVTRPTELALACPRCGSCARATQPASATHWSIGDCWPEWCQTWTITCARCAWHVTGLPWDALRKAAPLFYVTDVGNVELWAWNRDHLGLLVHVLEGGAPSAHRLGYFAHYMHKEWLKKTRRAAFARAARRMLEAS